MSPRTTDGLAAERLPGKSRTWLNTLPGAIRLTEEIIGPKGRLPDEATILTALQGEKAPLVFCGHTPIPRVIRLSKTGQVFTTRLLRPTFMINAA